ncbi:hypothetical protein CAPN008_11630 [Capnocytophaga canis]|uniref:hypothetical protein n=1 Tax=Capnocytophaga canis TaxID=1848903 RepID=UPI001AC8BDE9|nr:hypothetical protein [Capnocytophaga canis]GIM61113.1 hypothetical protein CAPN008_11630 [Capnocytophaga canis]
MEDYKEIIKEMLLRDFLPHPPKGEHSPLFQREYEVLMTTAQVLMMVQGVIPSTPINEHDVFEALKECGFEYKLVSFQHITDDQELISYGYRWILWKKEVNL